MKLVTKFLPPNNSMVIIKTKSKEVYLVKYVNKRFGEYYRHEIHGWRFVRTEQDKKVKSPQYPDKVIRDWILLKNSLGEIAKDYPIVVPRKFEVYEHFRKRDSS